MEQPEKDWYIQCEHEVYCQGTERVTECFLVRAKTYPLAVDKLRLRLDEATNFQNKTIE